MNTQSLKHRLGTLALALGLGVAMVPSAMAYKVYELEKEYYAIVCADGQIFSYSGSASGLSTVGPALCEKHGGIAGGNGGGMDVVRAPADVARAAQRCQQGGRDLGRGVKQCPGKVRVGNTQPDGAPAAQPPAQDYNSSRSNKARG